jgi:DNA-binding response OmpR family regulator
MRANILIVEGEALIAQEIEAVLASAGFAIAGVAATVSKAVALIEAREFDAALLDANLRGRSSEPVARALHQAGTPFLVITGYGRAHLTGPLLDAPHVFKPFSPEALVRAVHALIDAARERETNESS